MAIGAVVTTLTIVFAMILFMDFDGDGLANITEFQLGTAVNNPDTDGDGLNDGAEVNIYGTSPLLADTDGDGLSDYFEVFISGTNPLLPDTDNDGLLDGPEISIYGTNPLNNDTDNDWLSDGSEVNGWLITVNGAAVKVTSDPLVKDSDGDNLSDWAEYNTYGSDPRRTDTDGDGWSDILEVLYNTDLSEASSVPQLKENAPTYPRLYLEIDYMSGYAPSADAISYIKSYFEYSLGVVVEVAYDEITSSELTAIGVSPDSLSTQELVSIKQHFHDNPTTHLYVFYASALDEEEAGGLASNSYGVALNGTYISGNIARERTVLLHEVGHCLGLEHCDNSICAMQVVAIFENPIYCNHSWSQRNLLNIWSVDEPWT